VLHFSNLLVHEFVSEGRKLCYVWDKFICYLCSVWGPLYWYSLGLRPSSRGGGSLYRIFVHHVWRRDICLGAIYL
jgi:hypothetical protein